MSEKKISIVLGVKNMLALGLNTARNSLQRFTTSARKLAVGIGVLGGAVAIAGKKLIGFASDAEEIDTKFAAVYRSTILTARAVSDDLAKSFDLAGSTAKKMLADTGDLLTGFGFTGDEALAMSDKVNRLAIDLASFTNYSKGASGASEALTKLLLGETEQAKALGIVVRQGSDEYKNAVKQMVETEGMTTLQAKAHVALRMATEQSKNAIGDYARTQDGVANRQRKASEAFKEAKEQIGALIIENANYGEVLNMVAEKVRELSESGYIELWSENIKNAIANVMPVFEKVGKAFGWVREKVEESAAYWGTLAGGGSNADAVAAMESVPQQVKADTEKRIEAIKAEKAAKLEAKKAEEARSQAIAKIEEERVSRLTRIDNLETEIAAERKKEAEQQLALMRDEIAAKEELAQKSVRAYIDEVRAKRRAAKQWERDLERAERLRDSQSQSAQDFVSAVDAIKAARQGLPDMQTKLSGAEQQLAALDSERNRTLSDMLAELKGIRGDKKITAMG